MKLSLKEMLIAVAIIALALGFALHVRTTKQQLSEFESHSRHASAKRDFELRMLLVEQNFRRAGYTFLPNLENDRFGESDGTFERKYDWATNDKPAVTGLDFCELLRPLTEGFTNSQKILWNVESEPNLRQIQVSPDQTSGTISFRIAYSLH